MSEYGGKTKGVAAGRSLDWEEIFHRLYPRLVALFRRRGASLDEARDLSQDTFTEAIKSSKTFRGLSKIDTWIISIAKNLWLKLVRKKVTQKRDGIEVPLESILGIATSPRPNAEKQVGDADLLTRVWQAIDELPEDMGIALVMCSIGYKYREVAEHLGVSNDQVTSLVHQARKKLRDRFLP